MDDRLRHERGIRPSDDEPAAPILDDGIDSPERKRNDRTTRHLSLDRDTRYALVVTGEQQEVHPAVDLFDVGPMAEERYLLCKPAFADHSYERRAQWSITRDDE